MSHAIGDRGQVTGDSRTQIDLAPFCDRHTSRYALGAPRLVDGMVVATDGRILIRCQADHAAPFKSLPGEFPDVANLMAGINDVTAWSSFYWPDCAFCGNLGTVEVACDRCKDYVGSCPTCGGSRRMRQDCLCDGIHLVGRFYLRARHAYLVNALPDAEWQVPAIQDPVPAILYFRFAFGDGVVTRRGP